MEPVIIAAAQLGLYGGIARAVFALIKALLGREHVRWPAWFGVLALNALSGSLLGAVFNFNQTVSLLAGYASYDLIGSLNNMFRISPVKIPTKGASILSVKKKSTWEEMMGFR